MRLPRNLQLWGPDYLRSLRRRASVRIPDDRPLDILFCIADHYEPDHGGAAAEVQWHRVERWLREYPRFASAFRDADGCPPRHTFFYPLERYRPEHLDMLAQLVSAGLGEVEVHLHHDGDSSDGLRARLLEFRDCLIERHGLLHRTPGGQPAYAFLHGNWALDNARPDGRWCGVNDELTVLRETGCYGDFTMPSAPDPAQTWTVNRIYHAVDDVARPKSHDRGIPARVGRPAPTGGLLMVQGPLALVWRPSARRWLPRVENSAIDAATPPTLVRAHDWVRCHVHVEGRPEWIFVKLHSHGAKERNADLLLGDTMRRFHESLLRHFGDGRRYRLHYVTAREMANIIRAAEAGRDGNAGQYRDFWLRPVGADRGGQKASARTAT